MTKTKPPFRADVVGSLLRTAALKEARAKRAKAATTRVPREPRAAVTTRARATRAAARAVAVLAAVVPAVPVPAAAQAKVVAVVPQVAVVPRVAVARRFRFIPEAGNRAERIAAVEFGADEGEAADVDARTLDREVIRILARNEVVDRHAGDALERFGDAAIGQLADVVGADRIDDLVGVALDADRIGDRGALAGDDDLAGAALGRGRGTLLGGGGGARRCGVGLAIGGGGVRPRLRKNRRGDRGEREDGGGSACVKNTHATRAGRARRRQDSSLHFIPLHTAFRSDPRY